MLDDQLLFVQVIGFYEILADREAAQEVELVLAYHEILEGAKQQRQFFRLN
jgi:hypothetical protein